MTGGIGRVIGMMRRAAGEEEEEENDDDGQNGYTSRDVIKHVGENCAGDRDFTAIRSNGTWEIRRTHVNRRFFINHRAHY